MADGGERMQIRSNNPLTGAYFLSVIALSRIIGDVLSDLYGPGRKSSPATEMLVSTRSLDSRLLDWKCTLPRVLRFDYGHAFETSTVFRRQVCIDHFSRCQEAGRY